MSNENLTLHSLHQWGIQLFNQ